MTLPETIEHQIAAIRADNSHGAAYLARRATETLSELAIETKPSSAAEFKAVVTAAGRALVAAQPTMAPLFNLVNEMLWRLDNLETPAASRNAVVDICRRFADRLDRSNQAIAAEAVGLIADGSTVLTYSASATVLTSLKQAYKAGQRFDVICTESRPVGEGLELARELGRAGLRVSLVIDAAVFRCLPAVQLVLVGADSLSTGGLVNKIGTLGLAIAAQAFKVPGYALCSSTKFLPTEYEPPPEPAKDPAEIVADPPDQVTILNYYFDRTPLTYLAGVVTEAGRLSVGEVGQQLGQLKCHPALKL
ncbi:MAG TPA: translation initiation factor eIF-2B [Anaerolineae bacterium]|nr:translation initiation factor eIF-2B [Anaerolineae bacterium]